MMREKFDFIGILNDAQTGSGHVFKTGSATPWSFDYLSY